MPQNLRRKKRIGVSRTGLRCSSKRNLNPTIQPNRPNDPPPNLHQWAEIPVPTLKNTGSNPVTPTTHPL
jgi:hypothetical protein